MSKKENENLNSQSAKVIQLGFNISVSGNPDTDFQVVLDDKVQGVTHPALQNEAQLQPAAELQHIQDAETNNSNQKNEKIEKFEQTLNLKSKQTEEISPQSSCMSATDSSKPTENSKGDSSTSKELSLINDIKHTVEHFERFSDRIKECPRFKSRPIATSTPFPDRQNSRSEPSLIYPEIKHKRFSHLYDFNSRREYFRGSMKPLPSDLYLKPLPGENLYKRGIVARYFDYEPYRYYGSVDTLTKPNDDYNYCSKNHNFDNYKSENSSKGILKKSDSESGDKHSTSSADSVKDIKIYQSGGILIMQNFKEGFDVVDKKNISDLSATLIENCKKLRDETKTDFSNVEEKSGSMNSSDESKLTGKMVQFDLSECDNQKSKSSELAPIDSPNKIESSESTSDYLKIKDSSPQGTLQSQDYQSISTQENDSIISNAPGTSPAASSKKLEWDSGADVGYLNLDLSQENLSSIERIVLRGLTSDGRGEKKVVYEKRANQPHSKFILERLPSDLVIEEITEEENFKKDEIGRSYLENLKKNKVGKSIMSAEHIAIKDEDPVCTIEKIKKVCHTSAEADSNKQSLVEEDCFRNVIKVDKSSSASQDVKSSDKSVSVNTLFNDFICPLPLFWGGGGEPVRNVSETSVKFRSSRLPSKTKKLKKRALSQRASLTAPLKDKIESIIDIARHSSRSVDGTCEKMGVPKKIYRKVEANPQLNELELSRDVEEIIIDHRFKIKQNLALGKEPTKEHVENEKNEKRKCHKKNDKPISASSSSKNTPKITEEVQKERESKIIEEMRVIDQMVQTCKSEVESIGIQAFSSQKSNSEKVKNTQEKKTEFHHVNKENVNITSKNIQAFGLNSSLPKQLAHPKETKVQNAQNTKSTQFFGGPINSLPNYHCKITSKPMESCNHMQKEGKINKNIERDLTRLQEKNVKNILDEDNIPKGNGDPDKNLSGKRGGVENKENFTKSSSRTLTHVSQKISATNDVQILPQKAGKNVTRKDSTEYKKKTRVEKDILSQNESNDINTSDEVSSKILTSEVLKEHGSSIDRNIIKEKYFQSQLDELEKREMISKSTSMERLFEEKRDELARVKENVTVGCQYSPQSKGNTSDGGYKSPEPNADTDQLNTNSQIREGSNQYDSSQNLMEEEQFGPSKMTNQEQDFGSVGSCPSSTQTAHSWIPGIQNHEQNKESVIGRARSFEYLPGHIYECSGNLREELPSDVEPNITTGSSSSSGESNVRNQSSSDEEKISEGRKTLILENSNDPSCESNRMRSLRENLTELDVVVEKLCKSDVEIKNITRSLLTNFWKTNGSGDCADVLAVPSTPRKLEINYVPADDESHKQSGDSSSKTRTFEKPRKDKEFSIACQTEDKSSSPSQKTFSGERKVLESRIAAEKQNQIKWIENEIHHLNILRNLLEKQNKSTGRKQNHSDLSRSDEKSLSRNTPTENPPLSAGLNEGPLIPHKDKKTSDENINSNGKTESPSVNENEVQPLVSDTNYGMAVSLVGRVRKVMMFPVGVEFNVNDPELRWRCSASSDADSDIDLRHSGRPHPCFWRLPKTELSSTQTRRRYPIQEFAECSRTGINASHNVNTQFPSVERDASLTGPPQTISVQTDFAYLRRCNHCHQEICVCLSLSKSDKSDATGNGLTKENTNSTERKESLKLNFYNKNDAIGHKTTSSSTSPEVVEIIDCSNQPNEGYRASNGKKLSSACKCENCPRHNSSAIQRCGSAYAPTPAASQNPCSSNIYVTCEKSTDIGLSRCSKVQIQKSANCACHIIKIHDSKCCSSEARTSPSPKKKSPVKMENQFSQTEQVIVDRKNLITNAELVKPSKAPEVKCKMENKVGIEAKRSVEKKFPYKPKVSIERRNPCSARIKVKEKYAVPEETSNSLLMENSLASDESRCRCDCQKNTKKGEIKEGGHPRHYFLKIEEKEVDDSNESLTMRPSLEVITLTVPVKRNKSKVTEKKQFLSYISNQCSLDSIESYQKKGGCNCCERCIGRLCQQICQQYESQIKNELQYRKTKAEKPSSPNDRRYQKLVENYPYEEVPPECRESSSKDFGVNPSSSSQECYHQREVENSMKSDTYFSRFTSCYSINQNGFQQPNREAQINYDSYCNKYDTVNSYSNCVLENEASQPVEKLRHREMCDEKRYHYPWEPEKSNQTLENELQSDYYNYDKEEYMTRSEVQREEKKKKVRQPSLQECLESNRPDFYNNAESRRHAISQRAKERGKKQKMRMECFMNLMHQCNGSELLRNNKGSNRIFTTSQMREQTMKLYRKLPEVTGKIADKKKKDEYRTNKLMADVYAKKLQLEALKGHINLSNSFSVLSTI